MSKLKSFLKNETVLVISLILAVASCFFVTPDKNYINYIDFKTLSLLFCLMAVMAGLNKLGLFRFFAEKLLSKTKSLKALGLTLCLLCFFSSMIITNDVALITFVPFAIVTLKLSGNEKLMIPIVTLQTIAANLGSMLTAIGNPQNLYLFSFFEMRIDMFFKTILPYAVLSLVMIIFLCLFLGQDKLERGKELIEKINFDKKKIILYLILFIVSLLTVFRVIPYYITLIFSLISILIFDRKTLKDIDYSLLLTFVFLFVFIGNLGCIPKVNDLLKDIVINNEVPVGVLLSQLFSNVPAALLLSGFTDNVTELLIGVNLGGLGTLIASMASLISFKLIAKENIKISKYILVFTVLNIIFLMANAVLYIMI